MKHIFDPSIPLAEGLTPNVVRMRLLRLKGDKDPARAYSTPPRKYVTTETPAWQARISARQAGERLFEGSVCGTCGGTLRYTQWNSCYFCSKKNNRENSAQARALAKKQKEESHAVQSSSSGSADGSSGEFPGGSDAALDGG